MRQLIALCALVALSPLTFASPVTLDFSGTIKLYNVIENGDYVDRLSTLSNLSLSGFITYDTTAGPAPQVFDDPRFGSVFDQVWSGATEDLGLDFVSSQINYSGGLFTPEGFPATRSLDGILSSNAAAANGDFLTVYNDRLTGFGQYLESYTGIDFAGADIFGVGSASPPDLSHPQLGNTINAGTFGFFALAPNGALADGGFHAIFDVNSISIRPALAVPEPNLLAIFAAALAALGYFAVRSFRKR